MKLDAVKNYAQKALRSQHFEGLALGVIDFKAHQFDSFELIPAPFRDLGPLYFDLASLTKPLTLGVSALARPELYQEDMLLWLLEHRAGLPIWGRLSHDSWRQEVGSFTPKESECSYSDFSALRLQLEIEKRLGTSLYELVSPHWSQEVRSWLELPMTASFLPTGERWRAPIWGEVMDDNAFVIKERVSHAGLFGSIKGVCETLIGLDQKFGLLEQQSKEIARREGRFIRGWDTTRGNLDSLAGPGAGAMTFGHLGFSGTSIWIDPELARGYVLLTNATQNFWYDRAGLNSIRRELGRLVWEL